MKSISILLLALILVSCGGGDSAPAPATITPTTALTLQCDLTVSYTPISSPEISLATGVAVATVIAVHGKNGSPFTTPMQSLKSDLNAQDYDVIMPYMPWSGLTWDGTLCEGISYLNSLISAEKNNGKPVILLGHSLAGPVVLTYSALEDTTKSDAATIVAPGHYIHQSIVVAGLHASSIQLAKDMVASGQGDAIATFQTSNDGLIDISTTANIYLSFHDTTQFPNIEASIPLVSLPMLWLAGKDDPLTATTVSFGLTNLIPATSSNVYKVIPGDHFTVMDNVTGELDPWYQGLP